MATYNISPVDASVPGLQEHPFIGIATSGKLQPQAETAITLDNATSAATAVDATTLAWTHTVNSGSNIYLVVGVSLRSNRPITGITFGAAAFTKLTTYTPGADNRSEMWYLPNPTPSTDTITITVGTATTISAGAASWFGVGSIGNYDAWGSNIGVTNFTYPLVSDSGEVVMDTVAVQSTGGVVVNGTGHTQLWNKVGTANRNAGSYIRGTNSLAVVLDWICTNIFWSACWVSLRPVSSALLETTTPDDLIQIDIGLTVKPSADATTPTDTTTVFIPTLPIDSSDFVEATTPTDSVRISIPKNYVSVSETTAPSDADTTTGDVLIPKNYITKTDSSTPSDADTTTGDIVICSYISKTDSSAPADLILKKLGLIIDSSDFIESTTPTDNLIVSIPKIYISISDSTAPSDADTGVGDVIIPKLYTSILDSSAPTDSAIVLIPKLIIDSTDFIESTAPADSPIIQLLSTVATISVLDSTTPTDLSTVLVKYLPISIADATAPSDSVNVFIPANKITVTDTTAPSDSALFIALALCLSILDSDTPNDSNLTIFAAKPELDLFLGQLPGLVIT